jgi:hypothetical protein
MGNSCLEYKGKYKFLDDFEIEVVVLSTANFLQKNTKNDEVPDFAREWKSELSQYSNGTIDLRLDYFFKKVKDGKLLLKYLESTKKHFIAGDEFITEHKIKEWVSEEIELAAGGISAKKIETYFDKFSAFIESALVS